MSVNSVTRLISFIKDVAGKLFPKTEIDQRVIFKSKNVLTPRALNEVIQQYFVWKIIQCLFQMFDFHKIIKSIEVNGKTFGDICAM